MALVVYERRPAFVASSSEAASALCTWDPYRVLALQPEPVDALFAAAEVGKAEGDGAPALRRRAAAIRAAYLDLAAKYHPDVDAMPATATAWLSAFEHFSAIAAAYRLLSDVDKALQYALAAAACDAAGSGPTAAAAGTSSKAAAAAGSAGSGSDDDIAAAAHADVRAHAVGCGTCTQPYHR